MLRTRKDQSVAFIGRSGSGKTSNAKHCLSALTLTANCANKCLTMDKLNAITTLMESFGNSRTIMNSNATRFTSLFSLDYDSLGHLVSASMQAMLLEKSRVIRRPEGEPTFNIFYQMLAGLDSQSKREFHLDNLNDPNLFLTPLQRMEDRTKASVAFNTITNVAFKSLGVSNAEAHALFSTLSGIYHLGVASVTKGNLNRTTFARPQAASRAAQCLGELNLEVWEGKN